MLVKGDYMRKIFDSGLYLCRFSDKYNRKKYKEWMRMDAFDTIIKHAREAKNYVNKVQRS